VPIARRLVKIPLPDAAVFEDAEELVYRHFVALQKRLTDPGTSVRLVVTPERMVIDEARRLYTELSLFEVSVDCVVMNRLLPPEAGEVEFFSDWRRLQEERCAEVESAFAPLPVLAALLQDDEVTGLPRLARHGAQLFSQVDPQAVLCNAPRVRFERDRSGYRALVPLPLGNPASIDVVKIDGDLVVTTGVRRRAISLPRRVAPLALTEARFEGGTLVVRFERGPEDAATGA
jgi:arsenite-transporting ATPase